jgi:hypothetical protein
MSSVGDEVPPIEESQEQILPRGKHLLVGVVETSTLNPVVVREAREGMMTNGAYRAHRPPPAIIRTESGPLIP